MSMAMRRRCTDTSGQNSWPAVLKPLSLSSPSSSSGEENQNRTAPNLQEDRLITPNSQSQQIFSVTCEKCRLVDCKREGHSSQRSACAQLTPVTAAYCEELLCGPPSFAPHCRVGRERERPGTARVYPSQSVAGGHRAENRESCPRWKRLPQNTEPTVLQQQCAFTAHG
ncbi:hypothetical protein AOLI_G00011740 [Acnodon oligacanthus]